MRWVTKLDWKLWGIGLALGAIRGAPSVLAQLGPLEVAVYWPRVALDHAKPSPADNTP